MQIKQFDPVRLTVARPDLRLPSGAAGIVVDVYERPSLGYEVEFIDDDGGTIGVWTLGPHEIELDLARLDPAQADTPVPFGYKCGWLAFLTTDTQSVVQALRLAETRSASWATGIKAAYRRAVFVTPPVGEWTLAVTTALPEPGDAHHPDQSTPFLERLAAMFPELQYFATHRVVEFHAWARIVSGSWVRKYAYCGEQGLTIWNAGEPTSEETRLGLVFQTNDEENFPNEESVMQIAGAWSVNPDEIDTLGLPASVGVLGSLPALG